MITNVITIRLNQLLQERNKTIYWLSKQTGISYNALAKIGNNKVKRLELDTIEKICVKLQCEAGELLTVAHDAHTNN